jgi:hypothetical protein
VVSTQGTYSVSRAPRGRTTGNRSLPGSPGGSRGRCLDLGGRAVQVCVTARARTPLSSASRAQRAQGPVAPLRTCEPPPVSPRPGAVPFLSARPQVRPGRLGASGSLRVPTGWRRMSPVRHGERPAREPRPRPCRERLPSRCHARRRRRYLTSMLIAATATAGVTVVHACSAAARERQDDARLRRAPSAGRRPEHTRRHRCSGGGG